MSEFKSKLIPQRKKSFCIDDKMDRLKEAFIDKGWIDNTERFQTEDF